MVNKNKQKNDLTYQTVVKPKRLITRIVDNLNKKGLKSVNGGEYNYHKVYQVICGRWSDLNVTLAQLEIINEDTERQNRILELKKILGDA